MDILGPAKCLDYQGVQIFQVSLHDNVSFVTTAIGVWIMQVSTFSSVLINRFHCMKILQLCVKVCKINEHGGFCKAIIDCTITLELQCLTTGVTISFLNLHNFIHISYHMKLGT